MAAAQAAARKWGDVPLATETAVSVAESLSARPGTPAAHRAVLERIRDAAPHSSLTAESAALRRRCLAISGAAADQRHRQALREWEAQSWARRRMAGKPRRESPGPPDYRDLAAARDELARVVSSAMTAELDRLMPQRRPAAPPAAAERRDRHPAERPAEAQRHPPDRTPDTRPERAPARRPAPRDRGHEPSR